MKIAFLNITQNLVDRGAETFVTEISKRLARDNQIEVISGDKLPGRKWPIFWRAFLDPYSIDVALFTLRNIPRLWKNKYDVVVPLNGGWQPALVRLITWLYGGKMLISGQSGEGWDDRNNLWCFPDAFVAISKRAQRWARGANPLIQDVYYIPNGVDLDQFRPDGEKIETKLKKPIILCVGALTVKKRIELVIRGVAELNKASLLVVGEGEQKDDLLQLGKKLLGNRFELISVKHNLMPAIYRAADIFTLLPEETEAFGIVFAEAMATNLPVVTISDEPRKEIVGEAGICVNPVRRKDYVKALQSALNRNWGDKPRDQAANFDWDKIAKQYEEIFKSLARF